MIGMLQLYFVATIMAWSLGVEDPVKEFGIRPSLSTAKCN